MVRRLSPTNYSLGVSCGANFFTSGLSTHSFTLMGGYSTGLATIFKNSNKAFTLLGLVFLFSAQSLLITWPTLFLVAVDCVLRCFTVIVSVLEVFNILAFLRYNSQVLLDLVVDLVVYDRPECFLRFFVIYVLRSTTFNTLYLVRTQISEIMPLVTVSNLFFGFSWLEREVFDMFGIFFINHPDLRKILNNYCFSGFPLRRDFPLTGPLVGCVSGSVRGTVEIIYSLKMCWDIKGFLGATLKAARPKSGIVK